VKFDLCRQTHTLEFSIDAVSLVATARRNNSARARRDASGERPRLFGSAVTVVVLAQRHIAYPATAASLRLAQVFTYPRGELFIGTSRSPLMTQKRRLRARCTNRSL